ncbi:MAG: phospholipase D-like domain-containing protein, partial [Limisphaerales bacterium]
MKIRIALALASLFLLAGCALPGPRRRYLERIEPNSITNLTAYCAGNSLEIHYPLRGTRAFAHATWIPTDASKAAYRCQFSVLTFGKEKRATRKSVVSPKNQIIVRNAAQWKRLLQAVFAGLAPRMPDHGVLLLAQDMELVLFRNAGGQLSVVKLENKPPEIVVDHTFSDADFSKETMKLMTAKLSAYDPTHGASLFLTGDKPAFVLVDVREHLVVFLAYASDPEAQTIVLPGTFALRVINSLLIKSLLITAVKNPFSLIARGLWHLDSSGVTVLNSFSLNSSDPPLPPLYRGAGMNLAAWEKHLDRVVTARRHKGSVQLFIDGERFFPALIQSIETARHSVDVMVYIFGTDNYAVKIADILKQRSATVHTRVLMDDIGSLFAEGAPASAVPPYFQPPGDIQSYLKAGADVHVRVSADPWLATDHRKCFIIDGREAYIGGMNIGWLYRYQWHDLMVGLTGPIVGELQKDYQKAWALAGPFGDFGCAGVTLFDREHVHRKAPPGSIDLRVLRTATAEMQIYHAQLQAIRRAKRYIYIENAYFNDTTILRALIEARQRGVDVRVILPGESDVGIMQASDLVMANEMVRNGIRVFIYPGMTHAKAAIYD